MSEHRKFPVEAVVVAGIAIAIFLVPLGASRLLIYSLTITGIYAIVSIALNIILGLAGQVSFAQTAFMAIGGYSSALLTTRLGLNPWLALLLGSAASLLGALIVGLPLLRLRGHYFAMATFALALATLSFVTAATPITNGSLGISGIPALSIGPISFANPLPFYVLTWTILALALGVYVTLARSYIGRAWRAIATGQEIAASLGIDITHYKILAFAIGAVLSSVAGSLYVEFTSFIGPDLFDVSIVVNIFLMLFVGGLGSYAGPVVGAAILTFAPQALAGLEKAQNLIFFILLLVLLLVWPSGLFGRSQSTHLQSVVPSWLRRRLKAQ